MCNIKKAIFVAGIFMGLGTSIVHASTGESIGANINDQEYKLATKNPIVPKYAYSNTTTTCGKYSKSSAVSGTIWYSKNKASATCVNKYTIVSAVRGKTVSAKVKLPQDATYYTMGIYAGRCETVKSATENSGTGSTLSVNCN